MSNRVLIKTIRVRGGSLTPPVDRVGWIRIVDIQVPGGSTANAVYQDPPGNTVLQSIDVSSGTFDVIVESSYPKVEVNAIAATLPLVGSIYRGAVSIVLAADGPVLAKTIDPNDADAAEDTVEVALDLPPQIVTLFFFGGYPGSQTELKAGDTYLLQGTTDKPCDAIEIQDAGASDAVQLQTFASSLVFLVPMTVGDRGVATLALPATVRPRSASTGALGPAAATNALGGSVDGTDLVNLNNRYPSVAIGAITYPGGQLALKAAEAATVANTLSDFDSVAYDSPNGDLAVTLPAASEDPKTVNRAAGSYNVSVNNFRITANRAANDATTVRQAIVAIANVAPTITVQEPAARLRSGGNDGTAPQDHTITVSSDQDLLAAPTLDPDLGGARGAFLAAFAGGPQVWTALLRILDTDEKGTFNWGTLAATGLSGILTGTITGDAQYILGGFVARSLTFAAFATQTAMNVEVADFTKLQAGIFTSTNQPALKQGIGTPPSVTDGFSIDALGVNPTQVIWLDTPAAGANATGTAQITNVEETA